MMNTIEYFKERFDQLAGFRIKVMALGLSGRMLLKNSASWVFQP